MHTIEREEKMEHELAPDVVELEHLISIGHEETGTRDFDVMPLTTSRWPSWRLTLACLFTSHSTNNTTSSQDTGYRFINQSLLTSVFGYTTSRSDNIRETAWLDGLRGVAAFLVMVYHYHLDMFAFSTEAPYGALGTQGYELWRLPYLRIIWCSGHTQVGIFFVLSGFVLSWSGLSSIREGRHEKLVLSLGSTAFRRWMRLFVPCFLIGALSLVQFYMGLLDLPITREGSFWAQLGDYLWECERFANPFHLERTSWEVLHKYNPTMWTMPVEWAGSLVVFMVLLMISRIQNYRRRTIILALVPVYSCLSAKWNYWLFTTGILLADYVKQAGGFDQLSASMTRRTRIFWIFVLLLGGWLGGIPGKRDQFYERPGYAWTDTFIPGNWQDIESGQRYFWCWSGIMIIWGFAHFSTTRRFFERPFCRYLGKISFMLYLTHRMIGTILGPFIRQHILNVLGTHVRNPEQPDVELLIIQGFLWNIIAYLLAWVCMLPLALVLANWSTILVDEPSVRLAKWVDDIFVNGNIATEPERHIL